MVFMFLVTLSALVHLIHDQIRGGTKQILVLVPVAVLLFIVALLLVNQAWKILKPRPGT